MRCWDAPNRPGTGEGYQRDRGSLLEPSYFLTRAGRLLCPLGCLLSISISKLWGKEDRQPPHSPETSTASLGLAFTTYVLRVHRFSLTGGHASCGEKKRLETVCCVAGRARGWARCRFSGTKEEGKEAHQEHKAEQSGLSTAFSCRCRESQ